MKSILKKVLLLAGIILAIASCSRKIYVPVEKTVTVTETVRDTVVQVQIEKEYVKNITPDTTSTVETKYARSTATYHGQSGLLEHDIENKSDSIPVKVVYKDREVITEVPAPYPVEVEKKVPVPTRMPMRWWEKIFFYIGIAAFGGGVLWLLSKFKK